VGTAFNNQIFEDKYVPNPNQMISSKKVFVEYSLK